MTSTQKPANHDAINANTQKSTMGDRPASKPYKSGSNVHKGSAPRDPDGGAEMAGPNSSHHKPSGKNSR